ncbi:uncharacterized protein LOC110855373 [Folsomia candida]|uniref:uncharacterized protein LOC110855373 n=1 Tax=Folsomia candida TaxID=158441 RepID=UPI000B8FF236|nr:uncharacterized protein LOC110855373 [Folsomia candida]
MESPRGETDMGPVQFNSGTMESPCETSVEQIPLNNPIILTQILQQAGTPLKTCRLVSHFWNDMVLSLPNTRLALNLHSEGNETDEDINLGPFFAFCSTLDARLAKHICAKSDTTISYFAFKLLHVCDKFTHTIQILEVSIQSKTSLSPIYDILENRCPNLTQLRVTVTPRKNSAQNLPQIVFQPKPKRLQHI